MTRMNKKDKKILQFMVILDQTDLGARFKHQQISRVTRELELFRISFQIIQ